MYNVCNKYYTQFIYSGRMKITIIVINKYNYIYNILVHT